jgi:hypothetical protein
MQSVLFPAGLSCLSVWYVIQFDLMPSASFFYLQGPDYFDNGDLSCF